MAKKERKELSEAQVDKLVDKLVQFGEALNECTLYPEYQVPFAKRIIRSILKDEGSTITALFSRQSGKTETVAVTVGACVIMLPLLAEKMPEELSAFSKGLWVGLFAPVTEQAVTLFDRIYDVICSETGQEVLTGELRLPIPAKGGARGNLIKLGNGSLIRMHSANRRAKVESKTYHLILLDESQEIESFVAKKSISPMGAAVNATTVLTGTPSPYVGFFYDQINQNRAHDSRTKLSKNHLHFEADYTIAQKSNSSYRKYIEKEKEKIGEDSEEFRMAYKLIWPITKGMLFTKDLLVEKAYKTNLGITTSLRDYRCVAGLDIGKAIDSTVLTILYPNYSKTDPEGNMEKTLLDWLEIEGDEWEKQYADIVDKLSFYNIETLIVDSTGVGDPIRDRLSFMLPEVSVVPFIFSPSTKDIGYKYLLKEISAGRILIPYNAAAKKKSNFKKFEHQMTTLKKHYSGKFLNPRPVDNDKGHDDYCLSEDTEILTDRGFLGIDDMKKTDKVVNYYMDGTIKYIPPKRIIQYKYSGDMVSLEGKQISQLITPEHKVLYKTRKGKDTVCQAQDLLPFNGDNLNRLNFISTCKQDFIEPYPISDNEIKLASWFITEGSYIKDSGRYRLSQSNKRNPEYVDEIDALIEYFGLHPHIWIDKPSCVKQWTFNTIDKVFVSKLFYKDIPREWLNGFNQRQLNLLLDTLLKGDGSKTTSLKYYKGWREHFKFTTISESLANNFQELALKCGIQASVKKYGNVYYVFLQKQKYAHASLTEVKPYIGRVWCVETTSGFIIIRRNNKVSITGNCDSLMMATYATYFEVMPDIEVSDNNFFSPNLTDMYGRPYTYVRR